MIAYPMLIFNNNYWRRINFSRLIWSWCMNLFFRCFSSWNISLNQYLHYNQKRKVVFQSYRYQAKNIRIRQLQCCRKEMVLNSFMSDMTFRSLQEWYWRTEFVTEHPGPSKTVETTALQKIALHSAIFKRVLRLQRRLPIKSSGVMKNILM